jgi:hypothetical protein
MILTLVFDIANNKERQAEREKVLKERKIRLKEHERNSREGRIERERERETKEG